MPFRPVPRRDRKLNRLIKAGDPRMLRRSEELYDVGDGVREVYLVRSGHVRLIQPTAEGGRPRTIEITGPGELFGLEAIFAGPGVRRRYAARAGEATAVLVLPGPDASAAFRTGSRTFNHAFRSVFEDLTLARRFGNGHGAPATSERVADVLLDLAQRFGEEDGTGFRLTVRPTHQTLADLAGAHRSTVTTLVNDWMYRRILKDTDSGLLVRTRRLTKHGSGYRRGIE